MLTVFLAPTVRGWIDQRREVAELEAQVAAQQARVEKLREERDAWDDPAFIEREARERLKYVRPGERGYVVIDDTGRRWQAPADPEAAGPMGPVSPWYQSIGDGVVALSDVPAPTPTQPQPSSSPTAPGA